MSKGPQSFCDATGSCTLLSRLKFSAIFLRHLVPWPSVDIHGNFTEIVPGEPSVGLNARGVAKYSDFGSFLRPFLRSCARQLVLITNRKSYMSFLLLPKSVTLNDLERRNYPYLFCVILPNLIITEAHCVKVIDKAITMDNLRLQCLVVNVCRGTARCPRINSQQIHKFKT